MDDVAEGGKRARKEIGLADSAMQSFNTTLGVLGVGLGLQQLGAFATDMATLGVQAGRTEAAFNILSGGADKASQNLRAIKLASGGTVNSLTAMSVANQAMALGLANTAEGFAELTTAARAVAFVSPVIHDISGAISEIGLASANLSYRRLDQLGLSVSEVKEKMTELQRANANLSDSQAFQQAVVGTLNEKYQEILGTIEAQVSGYERMKIAIEEARLEAAKGPIGQFANQIADEVATGIETAFGTNTELTNLLTRIPGEISDLRTPQFGDRAFAAAGFDPVPEREETAQALEQTAALLKNLQDATDANIPGAKELRDTIIDQTLVILDADDASAQMIQSLRDADAWYQRVAASVQAYKENLQPTAEEERAAAEARQASILEQQSEINKSIAGAASKSVGTVGLENALELLKTQKQLVDGAVNELINSAVTNPDEIALRLAEIQQMAVQAFSDMAAMMPEVDPSVTAGSFETINQAMQALNQGFVDFLPSASAVRDELASLAEEVMFTGVVTDEQAAALQNYASVAAAIADETSLLSAVTDELGISFLYANPEASGLIDAMYQAQASYLSGSITAEAYAGMISVLGQQLLILAQQAGVATGSILALVQAQAGLAGKGQFQIGAARGNAVAARISAQQDARDRQRAIQEAERAAKRAAQEQERSAKRAGKELESAAKKAGQELKSALGKVPGLFSRTPVTEKDMLLSKGGVYQDKADEYLRRLQAEVEQNKDLFGDVDIESAKQSLRDLGVQVADDQKIAFEQFADAWESGLLFFDPANVDKYIDKAAVERELELQKKAEEGKNNIYKAFGVVIDEAVDAVTGGAGGGGGGVNVGDMDFTPAVAAAIDDSPLFNGEPYLLNLDPVVDQNAIWNQLEMPAGGSGKGWNIPVQPVMYGPQPKPGAAFGAMGLADLGLQGNSVKLTGTLDDTSLADTIAKIESTAAKITVTATLALDAASTISSDLADQLSKQTPIFKSQGNTIGDVLLAGISESFNVIQGDQVVDTGVADGIIASIGAQLGAKMEVLKNVGKGAGEIVKSGLAENISSTQWVDGEMVAPIATGMVTAINTQIRSQSEAFKREGTTAGQLVMAGVSGGFGGTAGMNGEPSTDLAMAMVKALNTQFSTSSNFFYATGQPAAFSVMDGYKGSFVASGEGTPLVTPMITAINTQIRASSESLRAQGTTMAQYVQHGFTTAFNGESFKSAIIAAGETMGAYLEIGILSRISGGALVEAIGAQILADMSAEVEAP